MAAATRFRVAAVRRPPGATVRGRADAAAARGLGSEAVPTLQLGPDETLHVLVPSTALAGEVQALSPRVRAHRFDPADGPPTGAAAGAQVLVPRGGGALPDGLLDALPRLRLVQLM